MLSEIRSCWKELAVVACVTLLVIVMGFAVVLAIAPRTAGVSDLHSTRNGASFEKSVNNEVVSFDAA